MKKQIPTLITFLFLSISLMGQNLSRQEMIDLYQNRVDRLESNDLLLHIRPLDFAEIGLFQLDSILSGNYDPDSNFVVERKYVYTYDIFGSPELAMFFEKNGELFRPRRKIEFITDQEGRILERLEQFWKTGEEIWENSKKEIWVYAPDGKALEAQFYEWEQFLLTWQLELQVNYEYNASDLLTSYIEYDPGSGIEYKRSDYSYDSNDNLIQELIYHKKSDSEDWKPRIQTDYFYNDQNQLVSDVLSYFDFGEFTPSYKDSFQYDEKGRRSVYIGFEYDSEEIWVPDLKLEYQYSGDIVVPYMVSFYVLVGEEWTAYERMENLLDEYSNVLSNTDYQYVEGDWEPDYLYKFERDPDVLLSDLNSGSRYWLFDQWALPTLDNLNLPYGPHAVSAYSSYEWEESDGTWENTLDEYLFYYSAVQTTSVEESVLHPYFAVYPNPVDRLLTVETDLTNPPFDLYLYNMFGQRVFRKNISDNEQVVLPDLPEGIYVLQLSKESEVYGSRRIIIQH